MTYAQAANLETCAARDCNEPVEVEVRHAVSFKKDLTAPARIAVTEGDYLLGYCLVHGIREE
jgi:hypothetical protein